MKDSQTCGRFLLQGWGLPVTGRRLLHWLRLVPPAPPDKTRQIHTLPRDRAAGRSSSRQFQLQTGDKYRESEEGCLSSVTAHVSPTTDPVPSLHMFYKSPEMFSHPSSLTVPCTIIT